MRDNGKSMTNHPLARDLDHVLAHTSGLWEDLRGKSLFITGGTGFVGTWLLETLCWADDRFDLGVSAAVLTRGPEAFRAKVPYAGNHRAIRFLQGDTASFELPRGEFPFVIHAATERGVADPLSTFDADVAATRRVLEFARSRGAQRVLFTSSGAVYGKQPEDLAQMPEEYAGAPATTDASSCYGQAKRTSEFLCAMYAQQYNFAPLIARLFAFVGPHLSLDGYAVGNFIRDALENHAAIRIQGSGTAVRSYLYAADLAIWIWTILLRGESARPYNVGSPEAISVRDLAELVATVSGANPRIEVLDRPGVPSTRYVPDISRSNIELGLQVRVALEETLRRTLAWHRTKSMMVTR